MTISFLLDIARYAQSILNSKFVISLQNILKKDGRMKLIFCIQININFSYRLILLILVGMARHTHITKNNKFAKSLRYLKKEVEKQVEFLCRWASNFSKNWCYQFWLAWLGMPKVLKITSIQYLCNISRKSWVLKLMIFILINIFQKYFTSWYYYFWWGLPAVIYPSSFTNVYF